MGTRKGEYLGEDFPRVGILLGIFDATKSREEARGEARGDSDGGGFPRSRRLMVGDP